MPCYDDRGTTSVVYRDNPETLKRLGRVEAMLCGVLTVLEKTPNTFNGILHEIDYKEGGFSKADLLQWWTNHKAEDERRRAEELNRKRREKAHKRNQLIDAEELVKRLKKELNE